MIVSVVWGVGEKPPTRHLWWPSRRPGREVTPTDGATATLAARDLWNSYAAWQQVVQGGTRSIYSTAPWNPPKRSKKIKHIERETIWNHMKPWTYSSRCLLFYLFFWGGCYTFLYWCMVIRNGLAVGLVVPPIDRHGNPRGFHLSKPPGNHWLWLIDITNTPKDR